MNKTKEFIKETLIESVKDYLKDNLKIFIRYMILLLIMVIPNFIKQIYSVKVTINLSLIIMFFVFVSIIIINSVILRNNNKKLKTKYEEIINPANENVNKFQQGDIVILKTNKDSPIPPKLSIVKKTKSEIVCRNQDNQLVNYSPEELLTSDESDEVFQRIKYQRQQKEQETKKLIESMNNW